MDAKLQRFEEPETGDHLMSEVLGIPLLVRRESSTQLLDTGADSFLGIPSIIRNWRPVSGLITWTFSGLIDGTISERLKIPTLVEWKPLAGLFHGTISERLRIPTIIR